MKERERNDKKERVGKLRVEATFYVLHFPVVCFFYRRSTTNSLFLSIHFTLYTSHTMPPRFQPTQATNQRPLQNEILTLNKLLGTVRSLQLVQTVDFGYSLKDTIKIGYS